MVAMPQCGGSPSAHKTDPTEVAFAGHRPFQTETVSVGLNVAL
jgi:hypothetical protein